MGEPKVLSEPTFTYVVYVGGKQKQLAVVQRVANGHSYAIAPWITHGKPHVTCRKKQIGKILQAVGQLRLVVHVLMPCVVVFWGLL